MLTLWIENLTMPDKPRVCMGKSGYASVKEMQDELIRRRGNHWLTQDPRYCNFEVIDRISNGVIAWKFYDAAGCWRPIQKITLEE